MSDSQTTALRIGVRIEHDHEYYRSPLGDPEVVAEERAHFADGSWSAYCLLTVVQCRHCGQLSSTSCLGAVVTETSALVDTVVWDGDPYLLTDGYLAEHLRELVEEEKSNPTAPSAWTPLLRAV